jgi:hypothetical protein
MSVKTYNFFFVGVLIRTGTKMLHFSKVVYIEKLGGFSKVDISTVPYWVVVVPDRGDRGLFVVCTEKKNPGCAGELVEFQSVFWIW